MSVFNDLQIRTVLTSKLMELGNGTDNKIVVDLTPAGILGLTTANIQILAGEYSTEEKDQDAEWVEPFVVKSPQFSYTPSEQGLSKKNTQFVIWVKTQLEKGLYFNEALAGMIQAHFEDNEHLPLPNGEVLTILKTYQQSTIVVDDTSGRFYNRVFVDTETYYKTRK